MSNQLIKELEKELEVLELAINTLKDVPVLHDIYEGTDICYTPIKILKKALSSVNYRITEAKK
jgi:hypothetical protein